MQDTLGTYPAPYKKQPGKVTQSYVHLRIVHTVLTTINIRLLTYYSSYTIL